MKDWERFVLVEVLEGIPEFTHLPVGEAVLGGYIIDWDSQENECCPYCGIDGLEYNDEYCHDCLGMMQAKVPDTEYILKHMFNVAGKCQSTQKE